MSTAWIPSPTTLGQLLARGGRVRWRFASGDADGFIPGVTQPTTTNTGHQLDKSTFKVENQHVTITGDGQQVSKTWFKAGVDIAANYVQLSQCHSNENPVTSGNQIGISAINPSYHGTLIDRCTVQPANPNVLCYGVVATNTTMHRSLVNGGWTDATNVQTDTKNQYAGSCYFVGNYLEPTVYPNDPHQNNGLSHSDAVQIANGRGHVFLGNTFHALVGGGPSDTTSGYGNTHGAVVGPYAVGGIADIDWLYNWFIGGGAQLSIFPNAATDKTPFVPGMKIIGNRFDATGIYGQTKGGIYYPQSILVTPGTRTAAVISGNVQIAPVTAPSGVTPYGASSTPTNPVEAWVFEAANG